MTTPTYWIDADGNLAAASLAGRGEPTRTPAADAIPQLRARVVQIDARRDELVNHYPALKTIGRARRDAA